MYGITSDDNDYETQKEVVKFKDSEFIHNVVKSSNECQYDF